MNLATSLDQIKGVGPKIAAELRRAGLETVGDILLFLPRKHEDFTKRAPPMSTITLRFFGIHDHP